MELVLRPSIKCNCLHGIVGRYAMKPLPSSYRTPSFCEPNQKEVTMKNAVRINPTSAPVNYNCSQRADITVEFRVMSGFATSLRQNSMGFITSADTSSAALTPATLFKRELIKTGSGSADSAGMRTNFSIGRNIELNHRPLVRMAASTTKAGERYCCCPPQNPSQE